ncbi:MAG: polymer-forming cytoskeletal protein [Nitrospirae bacterium]|nr:MAG: polymer-forming cytoskeletal protein [Nitrospirota bacterium]
MNKSVTGSMQARNKFGQKEFAPQKIAKIIVRPQEHRRPLPDEIVSVRPEMIIGTGVTCKARIVGTGVMKIDGHVEGEVRTTGMLIVGPKALVEAQIDAASVISHGQIVGTVHARKSVHLLGSAVLKGTVSTPTLTMDEGARLDTNWSLWINGTKISGTRWTARYQRGPIAHPSWWP